MTFQGSLYKKWTIMLMLGILQSLLISFVLLISLPVFILRLILTRVAPYFRPDLGEILNGQSAVMAVDYFEKTTPRGNVVITSRFQGTATLQEGKDMILKNWINCPNGESIYKKFRQYPVKWLGFVFWKNAPAFSVDNHVHHLFEDAQVVTEDMVESAVERLLNSKFTPEQSPWEIYFVNNFQSRDAPDKNHFLVLVKFHHCLADGFSMTSAFIEGLFQSQSLKSMPYPVPKFPKRSLWENLVHFGTFPIKLNYEMAEMMSHKYRNHAWSVPDSRKNWFQVYAKTEPMSIQTIKAVKNRHGVGFTSVLLSAISSAISQSLDDSNLAEESMQVFVVLPVPGRDISEPLTNNATGTVFSIPCGKFESPVDRLRAVDQMLINARKTMIPFVVGQVINLLGCHFNFVTKHLTKNDCVQVGLTNFPGIPIEMDINGKQFVDSGVIAGALPGDTGIVITVMSHGGNVRIEVCAETAVMSKQQLKTFVARIKQEIDVLQECPGPISSQATKYQNGLQSKSG